MLKQVFDAGSPALTFVDRVALEDLKNYPDLVEGARQSGLINSGKCAQLLEEARAAPFRGDEVLAEARILARVVHRIFAAVAKGGTPATGDLDFLNGSLARAMAHLAVAPVSAVSPVASGARPGFGWTWRASSSQLDAMLWPVARDAAELLVGQDPARIRLCAASACERLFLDKSKAGRRRWCQMETCGNRAKAQRYAQRHGRPNSGVFPKP